MSSDESPPTPGDPPSSPKRPSGEEADLGELVERTRGVQPWRRVFHAGNAVLFVLLYRFALPGRIEAATLLAVILLVALTVDLVRLWRPRANVWFFRLARPLASPREAGRIASSTWYLVGILLTVLVFPATTASAGILVLGLGDPAGSVVGRLRGRRRFGRHTVEGTAAFVVASFVGLLFLVDPVRAGGGAVGGALTEAVTGFLPDGVDDNLTIPVGAAAGVWLVGLLPL